MGQYGRSAGLPASVLDLGIGPQINAAWVLQGLTVVEAVGGAQFGLKEMTRSGFEARPNGPLAHWPIGPLAHWPIGPLARAALLMFSFGAPAACSMCIGETCMTGAETVPVLLRPHGMVLAIVQCRKLQVPGNI